MVKHLAEHGRISDEHFIMEMLKNRESLGSTGLGNGIAFPHGRSLAIKKLTVLFARSAGGVDFDALDGAPVKIFFLILAPSDKGAEAYLSLLSELINIIQKPDLVQNLYDVTAFEDLIAILRGEVS
jgi:PTS system fructose-specific IIC component